MAYVVIRMRNVGSCCGLFSHWIMEEALLWCKDIASASQEVQKLKAAEDDTDVSFVVKQVDKMGELQ